MRRSGAACLHASIRASCIPARMPACMPAYAHACLPLCMLTTLAAVVSSNDECEGALKTTSYACGTHAWTHASTRRRLGMIARRRRVPSAEVADRQEGFAVDGSCSGRCQRNSRCRKKKTRKVGCRMRGGGRARFFAVRATAQWIAVRVFQTNTAHAGNSWLGVCERLHI